MKSPHTNTVHFPILTILQNFHEKSIVNQTIEESEVPYMMRFFGMLFHQKKTMIRPSSWQVSYSGLRHVFQHESFTRVLSSVFMILWLIRLLLDHVNLLPLKPISTRPQASMTVWNSCFSSYYKVPLPTFNSLQL